MNSVGERIRQARQARGMTQEELARGVATKSFISQVERDHASPSLPKLRLIADRLGLPLGQILGGQSSNLTYLRKSAEVALRAEEPERAFRFLEGADDLATTSNERADLLRLRGAALSMVGRYPEALELLQAAAAASPPDDPELSAAIYIEIGTCLQLQEQFNAAIEANLRALALVDGCRHAEPALRARILTNLSFESYSLGQTAQALAYAERGLDAARDAEVLLRIAKAHMALGLVAREAGDLEKAIEHCNRALELHRRLGQEQFANRVLNNLGDAQYAAGNLDEAWTLQTRCLERARELHDLHEVGISACALAQYAVERKRWSAALAYAKESVAASASAGNHLHQGLGLALQATALEALARPRKASDCFQQAFALLLERQARGKLAEVCVLYSDVLRARGDIDRAFALMRMASERDFRRLPALLRPSPLRRS
jgi:tetratricopeptide (TPR) repeat protein